MSLLGYPLWGIQLLGRWGSEAVKGYVGEAALQVFTSGGPLGGRASTGDLEAIFSAAGRAAPPVHPPAPRTRPITDPSLFEPVVRRHVGDLQTELGAALRAEIAAELRRLLPGPPAMSDQATGTVPALVMNDRTKVVHVVATGPEDTGSSSQWESLCTWRFGRWGGIRS